jgi:O-antigen/teichoic acid export membrane protein
MWIYLSTAIITLTGYLIVIPLYGIYGAAVMTVISELYTGIALYILVTHYSGEGLKLARVSRALMSSIIMGVTIYLAPDYHIAIQIILGGCLYLSLLFLSGALPRTFVKEIFSIKNP